MRIKQLLLTAFVILTFISYSWQQKHDGIGTTLSLPVSTKSTQTKAAPTPASTSTNTSTNTTTTPKPATTASGYKDGSYTGIAADAFYGNIQVQAVISGGKITDVKFLQHPDQADTSISINQQADPWLAQEAIKAQSAHVDMISGATDTSQAFIQSLSSALQKALAG